MAETDKDPPDEGPGEPRLIAKLILVSSSGQFVREELLLDPGPNVVGRHAVLGLGPRVSEHHVTVDYQPPGPVSVTHASQTNKSFLDGVRLVGARKARDQSVLRCGDSLWVVSIGEEVACPPLPGIIGKSAALRRACRDLLDAAKTDLTVLIFGETGTGKESAARAIHEASSRKGRPFVAVNCGHITESLLESKLFGHVVGAFTGATANRPGL